MKTNPNDLTSTLTKREWLTGMALQGLLANTEFMCRLPDATAKDYQTIMEGLTESAVEMANLTITNLNKTNPAGTAGDTHV